MDKKRWLSGPSIRPDPIAAGITAADLVDNAYLAYNGGRLREACELYTRKMLADDALVGMSLTGALTPAGIGMTCLIPLVEAGFVDWIVSTGANLYHDTHFGIGLEMHRGRPHLDDTALREAGVVRIYDILFDYEVLLKTDAFFRRIMTQPEFQKEMGTAEFHWLCGKYVAEREVALGRKGTSLLAAAYRHGVPVYTSSPGDSSIGMNVAELELRGNKLRIDPARDVNETAAIVWDAKSNGGKSGVLILGGRLPEELRAPDRAPDPGSARARGGGPRLLPPDHRRAARYRGPVRGDTGRGGFVGQGGSGEAPRRGRLLRGHDDRAAAPDRLRPRSPRSARAAATLRPSRGDVRKPGSGLPRQGGLA